MSKAFIEIYDQCQENLNKNQREISKIVDSMISEYMTYHSDNKLCKERFVFKERDFNKLIELVRGIDIKSFEMEIKRVSRRPEWKVINQPENVCLLFILRFFYSKKDTTRSKKTLLLLTQRLFSGVLVKYFPHGCNQMVMDYTFSALTSYYLLGKNDGDINETLINVTNNIYDTYEKRTILAKDDEKFLYLLVVLRTSINSFTQNTAKAYYKAFNSKLYLSANQTVLDSETGSDISEFNNNNSQFIKVKNSINTYINRMGVDEILVSKVARVTNVRVTLVEEIFTEILKNEESNVKILTAIFSSFESFNTQICSKDFVIKTVNFLNSKYESNKVKIVAEEVMAENIRGYRSLSSNSKSKYKRALVLLYTLYLQKSNC